MPDHHRDDESEPHSHSREVVLRDGSRFQLDIKTAMMIGGTIVAVAGSWFEQKARVSSLEYEIRAEIVRVETAGEKRTSSLETKVEQVQETTCAIALKLDVPTVGCRRRGP